MRKRGNVQRIHICINTNTSVFKVTHKIPQAKPVVQLAKRAAPMLGKGVFHAPKNSITANIDTKNIMAYSAKNTKAKPMPVYSVWKPATSSDSASGMSNGARFASANDDIKYITNAIIKCGAWKMFHASMPPVW